MSIRWKEPLRWIGRHWGRFVFGARIAAVVWVAFVGAVVAAAHFGFLAEDSRLEPSVWVISLILLGLENVGTLVSRAIHRRVRNRNADIEKALMALLIQVSQRQPALRFETLGANVFKAHKDGTLERIVRFRPAGPQQTAVEWTDGKGAIGECLRGKRAAYTDWHAIAMRYREPVDEARWQRMPVKTKQGFTREEFNAILHKYSEVRTEPIWNSSTGSKLIGILTLDRSFSRDDSFVARLDEKLVRENVQATASVVSGMLHSRSTPTA